jgi:hypothetical protein
MFSFNRWIQRQSCIEGHHRKTYRMHVGYHTPPEKVGVWLWCPFCDTEEKLPRKAA